MRIYRPLILGGFLSIFMLYDSPAQNFNIQKIDNMSLSDYEYKFDKSRYSHNLSSELNQFYNLRQAGRNYLQFANRRNLKIVNDEIVVTLIPNLDYPVNSIAKRLLDHSVTVEAQATHSMRCRIPIHQLINIAETVPGIKRIRNLIRPVYDAVEGEGIELMNADAWHTEGVDGTGIKIAVIDGGFDNLTEAQTNGDIPATYYGQDYTGSGLESETEHGTAVAEAAYEIAPGADYSFYHIGDLTDLELAKNDLLSRGINVVNHSMSWFVQSYYDGTGPICDIVADVISNDVVWCNSAGNRAESHYRAVFTEAYNDFHDMDGEGNVLNFFGPEPGYVWLFPAGYTLSLWMNWDDYPTSDQDYDLYLYQYNSSTTSWEVVASSTDSQDGSIEPVEVIDYTNPVDEGIFSFAVVKYDATVDVDFTVFTSYSIANRIYSSSITDPGAYDDVVTVGAISSEDYESGPQESFSSQGPTTDDRGKPNLAGPDYCNSFTYGYWQGTSLSSPYVAGVCALIRSGYPEANESVIRDFLYSECVQDLGDPGFDNIYGHGKVVLPNEVPRVDVSTKIFLEGPYEPESEPNLMTMSLTVPLASPYPEDPRTVSSVPADVTDWVLVQLRITADGAAVASKSAFLHQDGRIVADDGITQIEMNAPAGNYYIVIKHRNHLSIMSANAVSLNSTSSTLYDFTTDNVQFYGTGGAKELESGVWGMWSGDINQDGEITTEDYTTWYNSARAGDSGYQITDINLDAEVTTSDYTIWYNNARAGASSEVPE